MSTPKLIAVLVVVAAVVWGAFLAHDARYPSWKEEVKLLDGRVIVVHQKHRYYQNYGTAESWVTFSLPEMGGEQTWNSYLKPMRIDISGGDVYVFGSPRGSRQVKYYRHPRYFIVAFKWNGYEFERIPFMSVPDPIRASENVFPCVPKQRSRTWTWEEKKQWWCDPSDSKGLLKREINIDAYRAIAADYARSPRWKSVTE
jgi:hypothetical protein